MLLCDGRIVTPKGIIEADLLAHNGKIIKIGKRLDSNSDEIINLSGKIVLPGIVDPHVHLREPGATHKEDFYTGTCAALAGGVTTILDMPNNNPSIDSVKLLEEKIKIASQKAVCDFGLHFGASTANFSETQNPLVHSLKIFMGSSTGTLLVKEFSQLHEHFATFDKEKPIVVHAEDEEAINFFSGKFPDNDVSSHNKIRDPVCEIIAVGKALALAEKYARMLHICHVSTETAIKMIGHAKNKGTRVTCEVTPHHLFLSEGSVEKLKNFGKMNPGLRSEQDRTALWQNLDLIDCIASDHAPHTRGEKEQEYLKAPSGVPGLETMLLLMLDAVNRKMLTIEKLAELTAANPAKIFGLSGKGRIEEGFAADFTIVDLGKEQKISNEKLKTKCGWTPFEGRKIKGSVEKVILAGQEVYDGENILVKPGFGRYIYV
jgi:dihydroorotase